MKITVITVTYNAAALIARTIRSVEAQDYGEVEHLIIDGNSRDETLAHVHHYQERNSLRPVPREIVCLSEPDQGLYDAMNKALALASGAYLVFLNAGDVFPAPYTLSLVAATAERVENRAGALPAVVYGDTALVDASGHVLRSRRLRPPRRLTWRSFRRGMLVCHQSFYARTDLARTTTYNLSYRFSADFDWCVRLLRLAAQKGLPNANAHAVLCHYLSEGLTTANHKASLRERFRIMAKHYGLLSTLCFHAWFCVRAAFKK